MFERARIDSTASLNALASPGSRLARNCCSWRAVAGIVIFRKGYLHHVFNQHFRRADRAAFLLLRELFDVANLLEVNTVKIGFANIAYTIAIGFVGNFDITDIAELLIDKLHIKASY